MTCSQTAPAAIRTSVVVTAYNCARYLGEALDSVLAQSAAADEIIVVDDGSSDDCAAVVAAYGEQVHYLHQQNSGISGARNRGIGVARGAFIALLDGDDMWQPDKLRLQHAAFADDPQLDMVFGHAQNFHSPELSAEQRVHGSPMQVLPGMLASSMLARREVYQQVGLYQSQWTVGEFVDWYLQAQEAGLKHRMLDALVLRRRIHTSNQGIAQRSANSDFARIIKASLDRRRKMARED